MVESNRSYSISSNYSMCTKVASENYERSFETFLVVESNKNKIVGGSLYFITDVRKELRSKY